MKRKHRQSTRPKASRRNDTTSLWRNARRTVSRVLISGGILGAVVAFALQQNWDRIVPCRIDVALSSDIVSRKYSRLPVDDVVRRKEERGDLLDYKFQQLLYYWTMTLSSTRAER